MKLAQAKKQEKEAAASAAKTTASSRRKKAAANGSAAKRKPASKAKAGKKLEPKEPYNLVIVESPAKAKTIEKFLGNGYKVAASNGHLIDLPKSKIGVDIENNFEPQYIVIRGRTPLLNDLKKQANAAKIIYLATDPDREGEAISWHIANAIDGGKDVRRIEFNEITKSAVTGAIKHPRQIDLNRVNAQQARRVLDRLVGYKLSPLLWQKVRRGLSAGRVQSVTVRLIVDRENDIRNFVPQEYWTITAKLADQQGKNRFEAVFYGKAGKKLMPENQEQTQAILDAILGKDFMIRKIERDEEMIQYLITIEERFWNENVMKQIMPDPDGTKNCSEQIAKLYFKSDGRKTVDLYGVDEMLNRREELTQLIDRMEAEKASIDQKVKIKMQDAAYGRTERYKVSWVSANMTKLDTKKLKSELPDVYERFCYATSSRRFLVNKIA